MANHTPPASFSTSHATAASHAPSTTILPSDISPAALDTLPTLTAILTRLQAGTSTATTTSTSAALPLTQTGSPHISQSQAVQTAASASSPFPSSASANKDHLQSGPLTIKDIPAATDDLRAGLRKARAQVAALPDMDRGIDEQEVEIRELGERIAEQRRVLEGLKAMGGGGPVET